MSSVNLKSKVPPVFTHEGAKAANITPLQELIRLTMACMLWEDGFYEGGRTVADRIKELVHKVTLEQAAGVAIEARENMHLRHVPLLVVREMARHPKRRTGAVNLPYDPNDTKFVSSTLARIIQRPDELSEFIAIYWKEKKQPLSKQVKLGLSKAFQKFNEYSLAKYNRKKDIMLRDVLFLSHAKPIDVEPDWHKWDKANRKNYAVDAAAGKADEFLAVVRPEGFAPSELLFGKLVYGQLETPDTWEVELSAGKDKAETFGRLMATNKLGDMAFLRNLRNMTEAGVPESVIVAYGDKRKWGRVLPFRFIAAARVVPQFEPHLERWMFKCLEGTNLLSGKTLLLIDTSGSMDAKLSAKSDLKRTDAAGALAMMLREICEEVAVVCFDDEVWLIPPRRGFALADLTKCRGRGTRLGEAVTWANAQKYDRLIVLTDEQSHDRVSPPEGRGYMINVAANRNGVGYGSWLHIDGFSEAIVDYIQQYEKS